MNNSNNENNNFIGFVKYNSKPKYNPKQNHKQNSKVDINENRNIHHHNKTREMSIKNEIDEWVKKSTTNNFTEQVSIYEMNKSTWDEQMKYVLKELTRNHKIDLLQYVLHNVQSHSSTTTSSNRQKYKSYTLLNENVWFGKNNISTIHDFELIIETFDILISNGYNFIEFSVLSNETTNKSEITNMLSNPYRFYVGVMKKDNIFPSALQNELFKYLSNTLNLKNPDTFIDFIQRNPNIIQTINSMIDSYYTESKIIERRLKSTEGFLSALINDDNKINSELRDKLYDYFTKTYWNREHFVTCLRLMINKISESNSILFIDNMQFILSRNVDIMTHEIFKLIVSRESFTITEKTVINTLLSKLVGRKDFIKYFESINIEHVKNQFIINILNNFDGWIEEIIQYQKSLNPDVSSDEFRTNNDDYWNWIFERILL